MIDNIHTVDFVASEIYGISPYKWALTYKDGSTKNMNDEEFAPIAKQLDARKTKEMAEFMNGTQKI